LDAGLGPLFPSISLKKSFPHPSILTKVNL